VLRSPVFREYGGCANAASSIERKTSDIPKVGDKPMFGLPMLLIVADLAES
jgi:hypothetical protein